MSPRRYDMAKKKANTAEFRHRILDATLKLHSLKGVFGTSWKDIALAADVSVGTVYKHFPTLDELVPACGELLMQRVRPPHPGQINTILGDAKEPAERLRRIADELFAFYHRGGRHLEIDLRERELPAMREWEDYLRVMVAGFLKAALSGFNLTDDIITTLSFMLDFPTYNAMRMRGIAPDKAAETVTELIIGWIKEGEAKQKILKK